MPWQGRHDKQRGHGHDNRCHDQQRRRYAGAYVDIDEPGEERRDDTGGDETGCRGDDNAQEHADRDDSEQGQDNLWHENVVVL